ncbi:MAG: hypothetical protein ACRECW_17520 [Phyllobacterium sp.]
MILNRFFLPSLVVLLSGISACTTADTGATGSISDEQPKLARYNCNSGETIAVENNGGSVKIAVADGETIELPASPSESRSRYGVTPYAAIFEQKTLLFIKAGSVPLECVR